MKPYYDEDGITIYHGDALEVVPSLNERVDLLLTDPPFFMPVQHYASRSQWRRSWGDTAILGRWWASVLDVTLPTFRPTASALTFCDDESYPVFYPEFYRRFDNLAAIVWDKGSIGMGNPWRHCHEFIIAARWANSKWTGGGGQPDILRHKSVPSVKRLHPVDKPVALLGELMRATTDAGDLILDPFLGGGSTLQAAKENDRRAIGIEIEERYCEIAVQRLAQGVISFDSE